MNNKFKFLFKCKFIEMFSKFEKSIIMYYKYNK